MNDRNSVIVVDGQPVTLWRTFARDAAAEAPTFVMVHGIGVSHRYFRPLRDAIRGAGDTLTFDLPGFGASPKPGRPWSVEDYAAFIGRILDELGLAEVVLIGHSMGAQFATELAVARPALVSHVVLIGPVTDPKRATAVQQGLALARDSLKEPASGNVLIFADYIRSGIRWYLTTLAPMLDYRTDLALRRVVAPVLVIRGGSDPVASAGWCAVLASQASVGSLVEIGDRRHLVQYSAPGETAKAISEFVARRVPTANPRA
ncbi:MAG: alpha/beta hydrolase [Microbacteriaceae bacterium]|nr:alpha/beta hydrolase [Microbacteriaceae bacterium]